MSKRLDRIHDMQEFAVKYLYRSPIEGAVYHNQHPIENWMLNRDLNYALFSAFNRFEEHFGEFSRKEIATIIEGWLLNNPESMALVLNPSKLAQNKMDSCERTKVQPEVAPLFSIDSPKG